DYLYTIGVTGVAGLDDAHFDNPRGVAVNSSGALYVADTYNHRVQVFGAAGDYLYTVGTTGESGSDDAHFDCPGGVAVNSTGALYVADAGNQRVQVFGAAGDYLYTVGTTGQPGSDDAHFYYPEGVAVNSTGALYVADTDNHRVQVLGAAGDYLYTLGTTGEYGSDDAHFYYPRGVAVNSTGALYVADTYNHRVQVFAFCIDHGVPSAPALSTISPDPDPDGKISLSWSAVQGAGEYCVYHSLQSFTSTSQATLVKTITSGTTTTTMGPYADGTHYFAVTAKNANGEGALSECRSVEVDVPVFRLDDLEAVTLLDERVQFFSGDSPRLVVKIVGNSECNVQILKEPGVGVELDEGKLLQYGVLFEVYGFKDPLESVQVPQYATDFVDFFLSEDGVFRLFLSIEFWNGSSVPGDTPAEQLEAIKDVVGTLGDLVLMRKVTVGSEWGDLFRNTVFQHVLDVNVVQRTKQCELTLKSPDFLITFLSALKQFFSINAYLLNARGDSVKSLKISLFSDLVNMLELVKDFTVLSSKVTGAMGTGGLALAALTPGIVASVLKVAYQLVTNPPSVITTLVQRFMPDLYGSYQQVVTAIKGALGYAYFVAGFLDPPTQRLDLVVQDASGSTLLGYDPATNSTVTSTAWGGVVGNRDFQVMFVDLNAKPQATVGVIHTSWGSGDGPLGYQLSVRMLYSNDSTDGGGVLDPNSGDEFTVSYDGERLTVPHLEVLVTSDDPAGLVFVVTDQAGNPVEVDDVRAYLNSTPVGVNFTYLGGGRYRVTPVGVNLTATEGLLFVFAKGGYLSQARYVAFGGGGMNIGAQGTAAFYILSCLVGVAVVTSARRRRGGRIVTPRASTGGAP
ncbi:MAG: hypothetical protein ACTSU5_12650, partial [Promethearchaeota archaeon]